MGNEFYFVILDANSIDLDQAPCFPAPNQNLHYLQTSFLRDSKYLYILVSAVNSRYLKVKVHPKLLISQSKFSGPRKFTLRYQ